VTDTQRAFQLPLILFVLLFSALTSAQSTPFHDDFNRTIIGSNYAIADDGSFFGPPILNGTTFLNSNSGKTTVALVQPSAATIGGDQFARVTLVNFVDVDAVPSLFLRLTLKPDKRDIQSGYELDFGKLPDNGGEYFAIYYKDPTTGWQTVQDITPSTVPIAAGSVVEFHASGTTLQLLINNQVAWSGTHSGLTTGAPGLGGWGNPILDEFFADNYTPPTTFHDDFNRTVIGGNYTIADDASFFGPPSLNGTTFLNSNSGKTTVALVQPSAATIGGDQFARATLVNFVDLDAVPSLFLRLTLKPDKRDVQSGYELDFGKLPDNSGEYFAIYYKDPTTGWQTVQDITPITVPISAGSVVEFNASGNTLRLLINNQVAWTGTHSGLTTGAPGLGGWGNAILDEFYAGNFVPATAPPAPTIGTALPGPDTAATVTWTDVATETAYYVERCTGANCNSGFVVVGNNLPADTTAFLDTGLTLGAVYGYRVRAHNDVGYSEYSQIAYLPQTTATPPATPTGVTATAASNGRSITLNWSLQNGAQTRIGILRCSGVGCTVSSLTSQVSPTATSYIDSSVDPHTTYRYVVYAANDSGTPAAYSFSEPIQLSTPSEPAAPTSLSANIVSGVVVLNWTDNANNETGYVIERCARYGCYGFEALPTTIAANSTAFTDPGTSGGFYSYRVRAFNDVGPSGFAEVTSVDTPCGDEILSPNKVSMVVGESRTLDAFDAADTPLTALAWNSIDSNVIALSTDDPPVLTAVAVGTTSIEVSSGSSPSACVATLTVYPGPELPEGTVKWSVPGNPRQILPAVPSSEGVADVFSVSNDWRRVQAITADGHTKWVANTSGGYTIPDFQGGFVDAGDVIQKYDGKTGQPFPAYIPSTPYWVNGIHTDGTVFTLAEDQPKLIGIDSKTGQPKFSIPLQSGTSSYHDDCNGDNGTETNYGYWNVSRIYVAGDGHAYLPYATYNSTSYSHCEEVKDGNGDRVSHLRSSSGHRQAQFRLLRVASDGTYQDTLIQTWAEDETSDENGLRVVVSVDGEGHPTYGYEQHWRSSMSGLIPLSFYWATEPLTNSDQGVILSWVDVSATNSSYSEDCDALGNPCDKTVTSQIVTYTPKVTTVASGQVTREAAFSFSGTDRQARIQPVLQTENGDYIGVLSTDPPKLVKFNSIGEVRWTKPVTWGDEPLYALADGSIVYRKGAYTPAPQIVTLDTNANEVGRAVDTGEKRSWIENSYKLGSTVRVIRAPRRTLPTWAAVALGNDSETGTAVLKYEPPQTGLARIAQTDLLGNAQCSAFLQNLALTARNSAEPPPSAVNATKESIAAQIKATAQDARDYLYDGPTSETVMTSCRWIGCVEKFPEWMLDDPVPNQSYTVGAWFRTNVSKRFGLSQYNGSAIWLEIYTCADCSSWNGGWKGIGNPYVTSGWDWGRINRYGLGLLLHELLHKRSIGGGFTHTDMNNGLDISPPNPKPSFDYLGATIGDRCFPDAP
jgi:hypothetical protein